MQTKGVLKNLLLFALSGLVTPLPLSAASSTWDGGGADGNWTTAANWAPFCRLFYLGRGWGGRWEQLDNSRKLGRGCGSSGGSQ